MSFFTLILRQTLALAFRKGGGAWGTLALYVMIVTVFTFALGPAAMQDHAGAVMCVALLFSLLTSLPLFYERDHEDGTLEQFLLQPVLMEMLVLAKIVGLWLATALPLLCLSPLLAVMAHMEKEAVAHALAMLALASPALIALGSIAAALSLGRRGGLLSALLVMPLMIPVLIFAAAQSSDGKGEAARLLLLAIDLASLPLSCVVSAALIKVSQD